jgi:hypothetical protein
MKEKMVTYQDDSIPLNFGVDWEEVWNKGVSTPSLPQELQRLEFVCSSKNRRECTLTPLS